MQALSPLEKGDHRGIEFYQGSNLRLDFKKVIPLVPPFEKKGGHVLTKRVQKPIKTQWYQRKLLTFRF